MSKSTKTLKASKVTKKATKATAKKKPVAKKKVKAKRVADVRKNVNDAKKAVVKVIKQQAADRAAKKKLLAKKVAVKKKVVAKKVTKKAVAKKVTKKQSLKDKLYTQYKIITQYSENLMQDVYNVVYRTKTLKRFINERLATKYIDQEVLLRLNEKAVASPAKIKGIKKELEAEFA